MYKIFVGIPGRGHNLDFNVTACLMEEYEFAAQCGVKLVFDFYPSSGGIADGRNCIVEDFLKSDCDKLFFLDTDITFPIGALTNLATKPVDFVAGCYRHKHLEETYPITFKKGEMWADQNGLLEVERVPFGFVCIHRNVFKKFDEKFPERKNANFGKKSAAYFQLPIRDGILWGEDYMFCQEWLEMGGKVYLNPEIELTHWDFKPVPYKGHIGNWLKNSPQNVARRAELMKGLQNGTQEKGSIGAVSGSVGETRGAQDLPHIPDIVIPGVCLP